MDSQIDTVEPEAPTQPTEPSAAVAALLEAAADQARQAVVEFSGDTVGEYLGVAFEDEAAATHRFLATMPGYQGWQWAVVVAAYPGSDRATVSEVVLVPGPTALLAPQWLPWEERVRPGDLGPGDLLAPLSDDPRLVPGYIATGDPAIDDVAFAVGFGRRRVLSAWGRDDAAQRWHDGDHGPGSSMARATKRTCRDCGFMTPLAGALGVMFGVCCNAMAADGQVVDFTYGCGAHSDTPAPPAIGSPLYEPYDDGVLEVVDAPPVSVEAPTDPETPPGSVEETELLEVSLVQSEADQDAEITEPLEVSESEPIDG
jgi:hypothetical protein